MKPGQLPSLRGGIAGRLRNQQGAVIVIAMIFVMIFTILGVALYWLINSQTHSTELERTDIKAFNVAEAGIDAGMLSLKLDWPSRSADTASVDNALLKTSIQENTTGLWDPKNSSPSEFLQVTMYDNVDTTAGGPPYPTTSVADPAAPRWDSNADGKMFVDSTGNVDDDRHRILILAQRQDWRLTFAPKLALWASLVDSNGQGLEVMIENGTPPVYYDVHDVEHKGLDVGEGCFNTLTSTAFSEVITEAQRHALEVIARGQKTYFEGPAGTSAANTLLADGGANGKVVYVKSSSSVVLGGDKQIGTEEEPVVVVIDTRDAPAGTINGWDIRGEAKFYGVLVTIGNCELRGTCSNHGALYCSGTLKNDGNGSSGEILYNQKVINNINSQYVINVNIVPNTWEEYTLPRTSTTVAGP